MSGCESDGDDGLTSTGLDIARRSSEEGQGPSSGLSLSSTGLNIARRSSEEGQGPCGSLSQSQPRERCLIKDGHGSRCVASPLHTRERSPVEGGQSAATVQAWDIDVKPNTDTQHRNASRDRQTSTTSQTDHVPHATSDFVSSHTQESSDLTPAQSPYDSTSDSNDGPLVRSPTGVDVFETLPLGIESLERSEGVSQSGSSRERSLANPELSESLGIDLGHRTSIELVDPGAHTSTGLVDLGPSTSSGLVGVLGAHSAQFRPDLWPRVTPESLSISMDEQSESSSSQGSPSPTSSSAGYNPFPG